MIQHHAETSRVQKEACVDTSQPLASIIIPAWNEERRIGGSLAKIADFVHGHSQSIEVIVSDDGSQDATAGIVEEFARRYPFVRLLRNRHGGKGAAIKAGVAAGEGQYLVISDADLAVPIEEVLKFLPPALDGYDVAIASREGKGAKRINEPYYRHLMGRVYNLLVQVAAVPGIRDTQCGFKAFRREVARQIFPQQTIEGWGFDVEILFIARRFGYRVVEVPVTWYYGAESKVRPVKDTLGMVRDLWQVRRNAWKGLYERG
jgi:dolichyl-phosphate beta-glucosyltransferase